MERKGKKWFLKSIIQTCLCLTKAPIYSGGDGTKIQPQHQPPKIHKHLHVNNPQHLVPNLKAASSSPVQWMFCAWSTALLILHFWVKRTKTHFSVSLLGMMWQSMRCWLYCVRWALPKYQICAIWNFLNNPRISYFSKNWHQVTERL